MAELFFFYFAGVIVATAVLVVALRNPIYSALSLLILFFHVAGLYVTLHAEFLAAVQVIVYAGAILVLYLFVVMLLNLKREDRYHSQFPAAALLGITLITEVLLLLYRHELTGPALNRVEGSALSQGPVAFSVATGGEGNTETIGEVLYSTYLFPFEVASLILLVAMIGAIILAKRDLYERSR
ncbi:NADH-quinone oxidoreductase subunit J family protein [Nitrospira sp. Kam-Ns4a]